MLGTSSRDTAPPHWPDGTFMAHLLERSRQELMTLAVPRTYPSGFTLINQGDRSDYVCLLRSASQTETACVKVTATLENGLEGLLGLRVSGDIVGELSGLLRRQRSATVTTCGTTIVSNIRFEVFTTFLEHRPDARIALDRMIAGQLDWANRRRLEFAGYTVPVRLARVLIDLVDRHGRPVKDGLSVGVGLSQAELGRLIGAGEDAVRQAMRQLRDRGLVRPGYRGAVIAHLNALRDFAQL